MAVLSRFAGSKPQGSPWDSFPTKPALHWRSRKVLTRDQDFLRSRVRQQQAILRALQMFYPQDAQAARDRASPEISIHCRGGRAAMNGMRIVLEGTLGLQPGKARGQIPLRPQCLCSAFANATGTFPSSTDPARKRAKSLRGQSPSVGKGGSPPNWSSGPPSVSIKGPLNLQVQAQARRKVHLTPLSMRCPPPLRKRALEGRFTPGVFPYPAQEQPCAHTGTSAGQQEVGFIISSNP